MALYGAIIGGIAGGIYGGLTSYANAKEHARQYKKAAKQITEAAKKYSGEAANAQITEAGNQLGNQFGQMSTQAAASRSAGNNTNAMANALQGAENVTVSNRTSEGNTLGRSNKASELGGKYNADTTEAQNLMKQADVNQQVGAATNQAVMNTAGGLTNLYQQLKPASSSNTSSTSDENCKEGINNESGLPESEIEDSMRQLETVSYKYKDPSVDGCDNEVHDSGFTAQSAEKTPLFNGTVSENENGIKQIDKWKLLEAVTAGIAQLQREIDDLEKNTSDELLKTDYVKGKDKNGRRILGR